MKKVMLLLSLIFALSFACEKEQVTEVKPEEPKKEADYKRAAEAVKVALEMGPKDRRIKADVVIEDFDGNKVMDYVIYVSDEQPFEKGIRSASFVVTGVSNVTKWESDKVFFLIKGTKLGMWATTADCRKYCNAIEEAFKENDLAKVDYLYGKLVASWHSKLK